MHWLLDLRLLKPHMHMFCSRNDHSRRLGRRCSMDMSRLVWTWKRCTNGGGRFGHGGWRDPISDIFQKKCWVFIATACSPAPLPTILCWPSESINKQVVRLKIESYRRTGVGAWLGNDEKIQKSGGNAHHHPRLPMFQLRYPAICVPLSSIVCK